MVETISSTYWVITTSPRHRPDYTNIRNSFAASDAAVKNTKLVMIIKDGFEIRPWETR